MDVRTFVSRVGVATLIAGEQVRPVAVEVRGPHVAFGWSGRGRVKLVIADPLPVPGGALFEQVALEGVPTVLADGVGLPLADARVDVVMGRELPADARGDLLTTLWRRGSPADALAIARLRAAWEDVDPPFLRGPHGSRLHTALLPGEDRDAAALAATVDWNEGLPLEAIAALTAGSTAWVGVRDASGRLIATARAIADTGKYAWIYDVVVSADWRGKGVGDAMFALLLDHPALRGCAVVLLQTRDAAGFYARFGFETRDTWPRKPWISTDMALWKRMLPHLTRPGATENPTSPRVDGQ
jgi:GNAT superfamily N-acetyltransferase